MSDVIFGNFAEMGGRRRSGGSDPAGAAAQKYGVDPDLFRRFVRAEQARTRTRAAIAKSMPEVASALGFSGAFDSPGSYDAGARRLAQLLDRFHDDPANALAAYHTSPELVHQYGGMPPSRDTRAYVAGILKGYRSTKHDEKGEIPNGPLFRPAATPSFLTPRSSPAAPSYGLDTATGIVSAKPVNRLARPVQKAVPGAPRRLVPISEYKGPWTPELRAIANDLQDWVNKPPVQSIPGPRGEGMAASEGMAILAAHGIDPDSIRPTHAPWEGEVGQEMADYNAGGAAGVGKSIGFNRGQFDSMVPRGADASRLADARAQKTSSSFARDNVNKAQGDLANWLRSSGVSDAISEVLLGPRAPKGAKQFVAKHGADFAAGTLMSPFNVAAELQTTADPFEDLGIRGGAFANLGGELLGNAPEAALQQFAKVAMRTGKAGQATFRFFKSAVRTGQRNAAVKAAMEMGAEPKQAGQIVDELLRSRERSKGPFSIENGMVPESETGGFSTKADPDILVNYTERGQPIKLSALSDEKLAKVGARIEKRLEQAHETGRADVVGSSNHNLSLIQGEIERRAADTSRHLVPYGTFDPYGSYEQSVARLAANDPLKVNINTHNANPKAFFARAHAWLQRAQDTAYTTEVPALGQRVGFTGAAKGKVGEKDPLSLAIVPYIPDMLQRAKLIWRETPKRNNGSYESAVRLVSRIETPQGPRDVWMLIRKNKSGHWYYDHQHTAVVLPQQ